MSKRSWADSGSSIGCVEILKCLKKYSLGNRFIQGTSCLSPRKFLSSRQSKPGIQATPPSIKIIFKFGKVSKHLRK